MKKGSPGKFPGTVAAFLSWKFGVASGVPDSGLRLSAAPGTNQHLQLTLTGEHSIDYVIEVSPDLRNWVPLLRTVIRRSPASCPSTRPTVRLSIERREDHSRFILRRWLRRTTRLFGTSHPCGQLRFRRPELQHQRRVRADQEQGWRRCGYRRQFRGRVERGGRFNSRTCSNRPRQVISIGLVGSVGSKPWVTATNFGIEPGWSSNDMNLAFPDVRSPDLIYNYPTWLTSMPPAKCRRGWKHYLLQQRRIVQRDLLLQGLGSSWKHLYRYQRQCRALDHGNVNNYNKVIDYRAGGASLTIYFVRILQHRRHRSALQFLPEGGEPLYPRPAHLHEYQPCGNASFIGVILRARSEPLLGRRRNQH